jgi:hypothetical protein
MADILHIDVYASAAYQNQPHAFTRWSFGLLPLTSCSPGGVECPTIRARPSSAALSR